MRLSLKVYFRKKHIQGLENIPKEGPFLIVANHPSSFLDAISIAVIINQKISFLAKSTIFKNKLFAKLLYKINLVPIFRAQDNPNQLKENTAVFETCYKKLGDKGVIMIFPEGTSESERRLRPIKTGAARIALGTAKATNFNLNVKILPVGLNYSKSSKFRSELSIEFGKTLDTKGYIESYKLNEVKTSRELTNKIEDSIKQLIINIDQKEHNELVEKLEIIYKTKLALESILPIYTSQEIVKGVKHFQEQNNTVFKDTKFKIDNYFEKLSQLNISDKNIGKGHERPNLLFNALKSVIKLILGFPIWLAGTIHSFLPYKLTRTLALSITKEEAFYGALLMSIGTLLFVCFYSTYILLSWVIFQNPILTLVYCICLPFLGIFTIYYSRFYRRFYYNWKFFSKYYSKKQLISELIKEREIITSELELLQKSLTKKN